MIGIPIGLLASNAGEWLIHKHILHGLGQRKQSFWAFHWHEHHRTVRRNQHRDQAYTQPAFARTARQLSAQTKEVLALSGVALAVTPLLPVAPFFTLTVWYCQVDYYRKHKRSHLDPDWAREHLPWHYDHHMGPNQEANWCVTRPWFDNVMRTREPYVGTEREARDLRRRAARRGAVKQAA